MGLHASMIWRLPNFVRSTIYRMICFGWASGLPWRKFKQLHRLLREPRTPRHKVNLQRTEYRVMKIHKEFSINLIWPAMSLKLWIQEWMQIISRRVNRLLYFSLPLEISRIHIYPMQTSKILGRFRSWAIQKVIKPHLQPVVSSTIPINCRLLIPIWHSVTWFLLKIHPMAREFSYV